MPLTAGQRAEVNRRNPRDFTLEQQWIALNIVDELA
jgi:hypothetical protein